MEDLGFQSTAAPAHRQRLTFLVTARTASTRSRWWTEGSAVLAQATPARAPSAFPSALSCRLAAAPGYSALKRAGTCVPIRQAAIVIGLVICPVKLAPELAPGLFRQVLRDIPILVNPAPLDKCTGPQKVPRTPPQSF